MPLKNDLNHYGSITIFLHWILAILIIGLLTVGLYMTDLPKGPTKFLIYGWHKQIGAIVLVLASFRLIWHLCNITPMLAIPSLEKYTARAVHGALYILAIAMPLSGWLMTSAAGYSISFFGLFDLPSLIAPNDAYRHFFRGSHTWIAYSLIILIIFHTLGALKHHFIDKNNILKRILTTKVNYHAND